MKCKMFAPDEWKMYDQDYFEGDRQLSFSRIENTVLLLGDVKGKTILDLGCGTGEGSTLLRKLGARVICVDIAEYAISICRTKRFEAVSAIAHELPFCRNSFDGVLFMDVIEHIPKDLVIQTLSEVKRVTKPYGKIAIHTMPNFFLEKISMVYGLINKKHWRRWRVQGGHGNTYTPWRLEKEIKLAGLEILSFNIGTYPLNAPYASIIFPLSRFLRKFLGNDFWVSCTVWSSEKPRRREFHS